jgi:hypothetical protein
MVHNLRACQKNMTILQGEPKNCTFLRFLVKVFQKFFKSPIRGIFMREFDCTRFSRMKIPFIGDF